MPETQIRITLPDFGAEFDMMLDSEDYNDAWLLHVFGKGICYESEVVQFMAKVVKPGDFCIDVGANVGFFTLLLSKLVGEKGMVLAFEPGRNALPKLKRNMKINAVHNAQLIEHPVWCKKEKVKFHLSEDSSGGNALWDPGLWESNEKTRAGHVSYEADAVVLDDYASPSVKLIKIDTEGAEQRVLEGAEYTLKTYHPPFIIAEFAPFGLEQLGCSGATMRAFMRDLGYDTFIIHENGMLPSLVPPNTEITYLQDKVVMNAVFSNVEQIGEMWPRAPYP